MSVWTNSPGLVGSGRLGLLPLDSRFSGAIEAVVALENAPYAAEANLNPQSIVYVVPDCFSAAL